MPPTFQVVKLFWRQNELRLPGYSSLHSFFHKAVVMNKVEHVHIITLGMEIWFGHQSTNTDRARVGTRKPSDLKANLSLPRQLKLPFTFNIALASTSNSTNLYTVTELISEVLEVVFTQCQGFFQLLIIWVVLRCVLQEILEDEIQNYSVINQMNIHLPSFI